MTPKWRSGKTLDHWRRFEKVYSMPIAKIPVGEVTTDDVLRMLRPIWKAKPETAAKARARAKLVLDHAKARGLRQGENPAQWSGHINQILPPPKKLVRGHHPAMPYADVPNFMTVLRATDGVSARALEFTILTAVRSALTRAARWDEFDLDKGLWIIPADRTKTDKPLRVPLSGRAVDIVSAMKKRSINQYAFPGQRARTGHIPKGALTDALDAAGGGAYTVHGFRSAFRDWVTEETNFQESVAEAALAHASGDEVERAYRRGDALAKRRNLMDAWERYCLTPAKSDNVIALPQARA
jgi:integrase